MVWRKGDWENFGPGMLEIGQWTMALGLLTWELIDKEGQGQDQVPPPTPRQPYDVHIPPVGCLMAPHRYPEVVPANVFPLPLIQKMTPTLHPIMMICFPLAIPHSQTLTPPTSQLQCITTCCFLSVRSTSFLQLSLHHSSAP